MVNFAHVFLAGLSALVIGCNGNQKIEKPVSEKEQIKMPEIVISERDFLMRQNFENGNKKGIFQFYYIGGKNSYDFIDAYLSCPGKNEKLEAEALPFMIYIKSENRIYLDKDMDGFEDENFLLKGKLEIEKFAPNCKEKNNRQ